MPRRKPKTAPPIESDVVGETKEERTTRLNFFAEAVRAGLHASGTDIMEQLMATGTPDAASCMLAGSCQFVAELYEHTASQGKIDKSKMRKHMLDSIAIYFDTYCKMTVQDSLSTANAVAAKGQGTVQ